MAPRPTSKGSLPWRPARLVNWEWDAGGQKTYDSLGAPTNAGLPAGPFSGPFGTDLGQVHPDDRPLLERALQSAQTNRRPFGFEVRLVHPDGRPGLLRCEGQAVCENGSRIHVIGFCQEVTSQPDPEEAVALAASLVEASDDAIVGKTLDDTILTWNRGAERMFGYRAADMVGRSSARLVPPDRADELAHVAERVRHGRSTLHHETMRLRKDGRAIEVQQTVSPIRGPTGDVRGMVVISRDISELKRLQSLVLETAERVQRRIGQDLHDGLSQQLSGIAYLAHLLLRKLDGQGLPEEAEAGRIVELVTEASHQARAIARGLLPVKPEPTGLPVALRQLASTLERTYPLACWCLCEPNLTVSDPVLGTHLYRIAQEAVHNAARHSHATEVVIHLKRAEGRLLLIVEDDGCGLPARASRRQGMGMETMKYRARAIGAILHWRARSGHGLRVICSLPLKNPPPTGDPPHGW